MMSSRAGADLWNAGYRAALEEALGYCEVDNVDESDPWERGFAEGCRSCHRDIRGLIEDALAAATGTAKTRNGAECEASQSGPAEQGSAQRQS